MCADSVFSAPSKPTRLDRTDKTLCPGADGNLPLKEFMDQTEKEYIIEVLRRNKGQVATDL